MSKFAAFAAGLGTGYLKGDRQRQEDERQAKIDAMQQEQFGWARDRASEEQRKREQQAGIDQAIVTAGNAGKVDENGAAVTYTNDAGQQKTAYQPDLETANFAAQQDALERGTPMPGSDQANAPRTEAASSVRTLDGGRKLFTGLTAARQAKQYSDENPVGSYAKYMALSEKLAGMAGGQELSDKYLQRAKAAEKEGAFKALNLLDSGDPDGALKAWNSTGAQRLQPGQTFTTANDKAGNKIHQVVNGDGTVAVANVENALLRYINGIDGVVSDAKSRRDSAAKIAEKKYEYQNDPTKRFVQVKPGTTVYDSVTGKSVVDNRMGYVEDINGNLVKPGKYSNAAGGAGGDGDGDDTGAGGKKKGKTPLDVATSSVMDAIKESAESKTLNADQLIGVQATARELVANAVRNKKELDPYVAGKVALTAVLKPESVKIGYNPATGTFENTVKYNGNEFSVGKVDQATMPESQLKGVAQTFVSKLPADSRADYIKAAAGDKAALDKFNADVVAAHGRQWAERFTAANGRKPTQQDVQDSIARTQSVVSQNIQLVAASGAVEQDKKQRDTATRKQSEATAKAAIGTPAQIMALPPGKAAEIYRQYGNQTDAFQREALQRKMERDRNNMSVGGMRQQ